MTKNKLKYPTLLFVLTVLSFLTSYGKAQISVQQLDLNKLPKGIKYEGKIKTAVRWTDKLGDNIVITTETGEMIHKGAADDDLKDASLFAYHFIVTADSVRLTWKVYDFIKNCPVDLETNFIKNTFQVTDLNRDGVAEVWLMYKTVCHGDVSPCQMKIIMYQAQQKFAIRGQNKVQISDTETYGGDYKFDKTFADGPKEFLEFAKKMWNKNIMQIWGEN
jgi:hypothetical protein